MLPEATQNGKKSKQGCQVTRDRARDLSHRRPSTNQLCNTYSLWKLGTMLMQNLEGQTNSIIVFPKMAYLKWFSFHYIKCSV